MSFGKKCPLPFDQACSIQLVPWFLRILRRFRQCCEVEGISSSLAPLGSFERYKSSNLTWQRSPAVGQTNCQTTLFCQRMSARPPRKFLDPCSVYFQWSFCLWNCENLRSRCSLPPRRQKITSAVGEWQSRICRSHRMISSSPDIIGACLISTPIPSLCNSWQGIM